MAAKPIESARVDEIVVVVSRKVLGTAAAEPQTTRHAHQVHYADFCARVIWCSLPFGHRCRTFQPQGAPLN